MFDSMEHKGEKINTSPSTNMTLLVTIYYWQNNCIFYLPTLTQLNPNITTRSRLLLHSHQWLTMATKMPIPKQGQDITAIKLANPNSPCCRQFQILDFVTRWEYHGECSRLNFFHFKDIQPTGRNTDHYNHRF